MFVLRNCRGHIESPIATWPGEHRLNLETLPLSVFVVGGDSFGGLGFDVVDSNDISDRVDATHVGVANVTTFRLGVVRGPALLTDKEGLGGQASSIRIPLFRGELGFVNAERAPLMIDETARPKLRNREEPCTL